ncbi:sodium/potassium/calcium exchanger 3-like isoform X2 [Tachysurus fulvidraco]|uniref:sodium/potassium/calcium exchanger 3-like isoform X2 n=1 Tax=Tachysurus fulvidraco TaxID=1234273 RepID=UPI001FEDBF8F|nr:sodium/potassium/calcium exchanger 3-like isoform X2 [Tachysurus fulvidraco]
MRTCPRTIRVRGQSRTSVALFLDIQLRGVEEESNTGDADLSTDDPGEGTIKDQSKESTDNLGKGTIKDDAKESTDNGELTSPFSIPKGCMKKAKWLVSWPLLLLLFFTIPNCSRTRWEKYLIVVFLLISTVWIAVFSYLMVWMVTIIRYTFGIPDVIMDITVLAIGTSIPDFFTSLTAARQGDEHSRVCVLCLAAAWLRCSHYNDIQLRGVEEESNTGDADLSTDDPGEGTSKDDAKKSMDDPGEGTIKDYSKESTDDSLKQ